MLRINQYLFPICALTISLLNSCRHDDNRDNKIPSNSDVAPQFSSIVAFGDSLTDSGNIKYLTQQFAGDTSPILKRSVPIEPTGNNSGYYQGRFSNGLNWFDRFISTLDLQPQNFETCFLKGSNSSCNYAVGGSTTDENLSSDEDPMKPIKNLFKNDAVEKILDGFKIPQHVGIKQMISSYTNFSKPDQNVMNQTLYVIWGGGNDYFANETPENTVGNLIASIKNILDYNADNQKRYILIPNLPDLNATPYGAAHPDLNLAEKTNEHNLLLQKQIDEQINNNPQYKDKAVIVFVDVASAFSQVYSNPSKYDFTNVKDACYKGGYMPGEENSDCGDGEHYIFWDNIHPTTKAHCIATKAALQAMNNAHLLAKPKVIDNFKCN